MGMRAGDRLRAGLSTSARAAAWLGAGVAVTGLAAGLLGPTAGMTVATLAVIGTAFRGVMSLRRIGQGHACGGDCACRASRTGAAP